MEIEALAHRKLPPLVNDQAETKHAGVYTMNAGGLFFPRVTPCLGDNVLKLFQLIASERIPFNVGFIDPKSSDLLVAALLPGTLCGCAVINFSNLISKFVYWT